MTAPVLASTANEVGPAVQIGFETPDDLQMS